MKTLATHMSGTGVLNATTRSRYLQSVLAKRSVTTGSGAWVNKAFGLGTALSVGLALLVGAGAPATAQAQLDDDDDMLLLYLPAILGDTKQNTQSGSSSSGGVTSGGSGGETPIVTGPGVPDDEAELTVVRNGDRLIVSSNAIPTWRVVFEIGSGAPGGGTATSLYIPASSTESVVENRPYMNCCSGLGLDNLEWRWRPFGSGSGTRAALGTSSVVDSFRINSQTSRTLEFTVRGRWDGVSSFERRNSINVKGYTGAISATYSGTTGRDSMWWLIAMFNEKDLKSKNVTIEDANTSPFLLRKTTVGTPLPSSISFPYKINYPLRSGHGVTLTMTRLADTASGNPRFYEFFDSGFLHGTSVNLGPYFVVYPRWTGVHQNKTYNFNYKWKFTN